MYSENVYSYFAMHRIVEKLFNLSSMGAEKWKITKTLETLSANQSLFVLFFFFKLMWLHVAKHN